MYSLQHQKEGQKPLSPSLLHTWHSLGFFVALPKARKECAAQAEFLWVPGHCSGWPVPKQSTEGGRGQNPEWPATAGWESHFLPQTANYEEMPRRALGREDRVWALHTQSPGSQSVTH